MRRKIVMALSALVALIALAAVPAEAAGSYFLYQRPISMRHHPGVFTEFSHGADVHWRMGWPRGNRRPAAAWVDARTVDLLVRSRYGPLSSCLHIPFAYTGTLFHIAIKDKVTGYRWKHNVFVPCRTWRWSWKITASLRTAPDFPWWTGCNWRKWPTIRVTAQDEFVLKKDNFYPMGPRRFHNPRC